MPLHRTPHAAKYSQTSNCSKGTPSVAHRRSRLIASLGGRLTLGLAMSVSMCVVESSQIQAAEAEWIDVMCLPATPNPCDPCESNPHVYPHRHVQPASPIPQNWYQPSSPQHNAPVPQPQYQGQPGQSLTPFDPPVTNPNMPTPSQDTSPGDEPLADTNAAAQADTPAEPQPDQAPAADNSTAPSANNNNFDNVNASDLQSSFASAQSSFSAAPTFIGDFAGSGLAQFTGTIVDAHSGYAIGTGSPIPTFDIAPGGGFNPDLIAIGPGFNASGDIGTIDTFDLAEPLPPTDAPLAPGLGFVFQGGTIVYTNNSTDTTAQDGTPVDGDLWYYDYSYERNLTGSVAGPRPVPSPGVSVSRIKISENYSPEVRNRAFLNYSFFNDFAGGLGDISRFVAGVERVLVEDLLSFEIRLPVAATYGSRQDLNAVEDRSMEIGNVAFIGKASLFRTDRFLWAGGMGVSVPTADDTELSIGGLDLVRIENQTVQIQPFTSVLGRFGDWTAQAYMQLDVAAGGDPVLVNNNLANPGIGTLQEIGVFTDSTLMHLDVSLHALLYQRQLPQNGINSIIGNAELHYSATLQEADLVSGNGFRYTSLQPNFNVVNATFGTHLVSGKKNNIIITPAMAIPLRDGLDEQFDFEALVQINYLH